MPTTPLRDQASDPHKRAEAVLRIRPLETRVIPKPSSEVGQGWEAHRIGVPVELKSAIGKASAEDLSPYRSGMSRIGSEESTAT